MHLFIMTTLDTQLHKDVPQMHHKQFIWKTAKRVMQMCSHRCRPVWQDAVSFARSMQVYGIALQQQSMTQETVRR